MGSFIFDKMKISVVIATKNRANTLKDALESVLKQDYADTECIVADGGSNDGTIEILKHYSTLFKGRLKWISEPDNGMYCALNKGIRLATGDIIGALNSDDFYHRNDVLSLIAKQFCNTTQHNTTQHNTTQAVYADVRFIDDKDKSRTIRLYSCKHFSNKLFRFGDQPAHPTFFTYKSNFEKFGYYDESFKIAGDFDLMMRFMLARGLHAEYIPQILVTMRTGGMGNAKSNISLKNAEILRACKKNGVKTSTPLLFLRYFKKISQFIVIGNYGDNKA